MIDHRSPRPTFNLSPPLLLNQSSNDARFLSLHLHGTADIMILRCIYLLAAALLSFVLADVEVTGPEAGDTITGLTLQFKWKDSGKSPALTDLASYQVFLCAGGNSDTNFVSYRRLDMNMRG